MNIHKPSHMSVFTTSGEVKDFPIMRCVNSKKEADGYSIIAQLEEGKPFPTGVISLRVDGGFIPGESKHVGFSTNTNEASFTFIPKAKDVSLEVFESLDD